MASHKLIKLSKGNLVLIQSIAGKTKDLNDIDFPQITIKQYIFADSHFTWD